MEAAPKLLIWIAPRLLSTLEYQVVALRNQVVAQVNQLANRLRAICLVQHHMQERLQSLDVAPCLFLGQLVSILGQLCQLNLLRPLVLFSLELLALLP